MKTLADLKAIREKAQQEMKLRNSNVRIKVVVGMGTSGIAAGAKDVMKTFIDEVSTRALTDVVVSQTGEKGLSSMEPVVDVIEEGKPRYCYGNINSEIAKRIVVEHLVNGNPVKEFLISTE
ncbi:MAG TPA: (2Fe-2S) ferredoxin domain-containing protein [Candidatus Cloacimonadota bacterium]|nr:(2Fe-2S) ferredoxin domain-containing protein [Candidatus Cloacimonadota bacterium]HOQ79846.1 (2Fe-2S) ferredoxin domain-containing protein [Candidatus Cloacimonadota bacterium]HPK40346.1 (2Fe-2S) ferredoxin domain-containing protein [Candidatus Cloacimonadota bacterium]